MSHDAYAGVWGSGHGGGAYGGTYSHAYGDGYWSGAYALSPEEIRDALRPLIDRLATYDEMRERLEVHGGKVRDLKALTEHLAGKFKLHARAGAHSVAMTDPAAMRAAVRSVAAGDVHLQVRQLDTRMPVYYLCRLREDYWREYSLVVEDLYVSPRYPMDDERFVSLMKGGHEVFHLRLSPFREAAAVALAGREAPDGGQVGAIDARRIDRVLYDLGRHIFQAAWHEDQRPGILVARHWQLPRFRDAIELLYLCLSGDLCDLRAVVDETMRRFFAIGYAQPAISALLARIAEVDGGTLDELPPTALEQYTVLTSALSQFLNTEASPRSNGAPVPLYKLVYGNFSRLGAVADAVISDGRIAAARQRLEASARDVTAAVLAAAGPDGPATARR